MSRDTKTKQTQIRAHIAAAAARLMAEDGIEDFALAKRKAARQLGASDGAALPDNEEVEAQLHAYQDLYHGEEQKARIESLRSRALEVMRNLERFRPYLVGSVLHGTAGRYGEIEIQLFVEDSKAVELFLLNRGVAYDVSDLRSHVGDRLRAVPVLRCDWSGIPVNLAVHAAISLVVRPDFSDCGYSGTILPVLSPPTRSTTGLVIRRWPLKMSSLPNMATSVPAGSCFARHGWLKNVALR